MMMTMMMFLEILTTIVVCVGFIGAEVINTGYHLSDTEDHPCARQCSENDQPKLCKYYWIIENYYVLSAACMDCPFNQSHCYLPDCVPANGVLRGIRTANRKLPGPAIDVCEGDTIEVTIDNRMHLSEATSIHWHGMLQRGSQYMDGVSQVTQCPINAHTKFTYRFLANYTGTHFWHAHAGIQRADGLFGSLIVRRLPNLEPHLHLYDFDLPEHVLLVTDWFVEDSMSAVAGILYSSRPTNDILLLINGLGPFKEIKDASNTSAFTPHASFTVQPGKRYRFRVINAASNNCYNQISVDSHNLTMIASDGHPFEPFLVESFYIFPGERFDFILHATETIRNYWIRVRGFIECSRRLSTQTAILKYAGSNDELPPESTTWHDGERSGVALNKMKDSEDDLQIDISRMRSEDPDDDLLTSEPDKKIYMTMSLNLPFLDKNIDKNATAYQPTTVPAVVQLNNAQFDHFSFKMPPSPLLYQMDDIEKDEFCKIDTNDTKCLYEQCSCIHLIKLDLGIIVEIVLISEQMEYNSDHPVHLHGYKFRVIGIDTVNTSISLEVIKEMDARGELIRRATKAPIKDTVIVPGGGYTIIRFKTDNPGMWLMHCHFEFHMEIGMAAVFQVGTREQMPKKPHNFPTCGNW